MRHFKTANGLNLIDDHEFVYAYLVYTNNKALDNHNQLASNDIIPVGGYLHNAYGISDASSDSLFPYDKAGDLMSKSEIQQIAVAYNASTDYNDVKKGTSICN